MKYNLFYLLALCSLLFAACQHDTELGNETNPDYENEEELQEVSFSFSFDTSANMEIEYEPMTRAESGEDWVRISNTFFYVVETVKRTPIEDGNAIVQHTIVKTGTAKFNSTKHDDDYVCLPEELDGNPRIYLPINGGLYEIKIFTGANAMEFNEDLKEGDSYSYYERNYQILDPEPVPFAIRYKSKKKHAVRYCEELLSGMGWEPEDDGIVYLEDYLLDEVLYTGKNYFHIYSRYLSPDEPVNITLSPKVTTIRPLLQLPEMTVLKEWNPDNEAMVACFEITDPSDVFADGINLMGFIGWRNPDKEGDMTRRLYYHIDPNPQTGADERDYLTGSHQRKRYYLPAVGGTTNAWGFQVLSTTIFPAGLMELYNPEYADYTTETKPLIPYDFILQGGFRSVSDLAESVYTIQKGNDDDFELKAQNHPFGTGGYGTITQLLFPHWHDYYKPENE